MSPLTDGCAVLGSDGSLPWPLSKVTLAVMHQRIIVIRATKTVDHSVVVFVKVVFLVLFDQKKKHIHTIYDPLAQVHLTPIKGSYVLALFGKKNNWESISLLFIQNICPFLIG